MPEYEAGLVCRWGCDMRMDGVDDMARASARRYECGPPVVQVVERNNAPSKDSRCARGNRHKHVGVARKAATSSTLSAYVRRGGQLAKAWVEEE